jgi:ABC-type branched-subunit amino acid transport system substrate-binding protein
MRRQLFRALVPVMVFGLLAAACGDDDDSASSATTAAAANTATTTAGSTAGSGSATTAASGSGATTSGDCQKPTGDPIKVGVIGQLQFFPGMDSGAKAAAYRANCAGGVKGRPFQVVEAIDDNNDAQANLDGIKRLVDQDKVDLVVVTSSVFLPQSSDYLAQKQIPFSGWGYMPGFCLPNQWGFGFNGCLSGFAFGVKGAQMNRSLVDPLAKVTNNPKYTVISFIADNEGAKGGVPQYNALWGSQQLDMQFVPAGVTDFTPYVNTVIQKKPDVVNVSLNLDQAVPFEAALTQAGYKGVIYGYSQYIPGLLESSPDTAAALEGTYAVTQFPPAEANKAATAQIATDLKAVGADPFVSQGSQAGYWSMDTLVQILNAVAAQGDVTDKALIQKTANDTGIQIDFKLDGAPCAWNTKSAHVDGVPGAGVVKIQGAKYSVAVPFQCWTLQPAPS